jgi:hypothetical protein
MNTDLQLTTKSLDYLNQTRKWTYFLSILGFITCGILALLGLFLSTFLSILDEFSNNFSDSTSLTGGALIFVSIFYLGIALLVFLMYRYLYRFSIQLKAALESNNSATLEKSLKNLKSYWKFTGIITIIVLGFYVLGVLAALIGVIFAGSIA